MQEAFLSAKEDMLEVLGEFLSANKDEFSSVNEWSDKSFVLLEDFVSRGKMLRGGLVVLFGTALGASRSDAVRVGAALELFQSGILIHDDIMDGDDTRRGRPAVHASLASEHGDRFGLGGGICVGDVSLFLSFRLLNSVSNSSLIELFSREAASLGFGQMQDVFFGVNGSHPSVEEILSVYRFKTARYTFCLPLLLACCLADREDLYDQVCVFGEEIGVSFQIRDDVLGLFGSSEDTGKPVGADVRENKKTLVRFELLRLVDDESVSLLFGSDVSDEQVARIQQVAEDAGVLSAVELHARSAESRAENALDDLPVPVDARKVLEWIVGYNRSRVR